MREAPIAFFVLFGAIQAVCEPRSNYHCGCMRMLMGHTHNTCTTMRFHHLCVSRVRHMLGIDWRIAIETISSGLGVHVTPCHTRLTRTRKPLPPETADDLPRTPQAFRKQQGEERFGPELRGGWIHNFYFHNIAPPRDAHCR